MKQFVLNVDPSVWNVVKFFSLSIIIIPIIEFLLHSLITSRVTHTVRGGKQLQMFDSRVGIFALHSKYAGSHRNRFWLACCALFALGTQLLLEYSFSSTQIEQFESVSVWEGPRHESRYFGTNNSLIDDEPTRFLDDMASGCVDSPRAFNRSQTDFPQYPEVKTKLTYNASFRIRSPYMRDDSKDVACGTSNKEQNAYFMVPSLVEAGIGFEGLDTNCRVSSFDEFPFWFHRLRLDQFQVTASFDFEGVLATVFRGEHSICIKRDEDLGDGTCAISNGTEIVVGRATGSDAPNILLCIRMFISGDGMQRLHEPGRKVRLLAYLSETRVFEPNFVKEADKLISPSTLGQVAQVALVVANEGGVVGVEESASLRDITLPEKRNVTTVSALAFIPASILLATALILAAYDVFVRMSIAKMEGKGKGLSGGTFSHSRVDMSIDWVRDRVAADLTRSGVRTCAIEDLRVRLVGHGDTSRIQVFPDGMGMDDTYDS